MPAASSASSSASAVAALAAWWRPRRPIRVRPRRGSSTIDPVAVPAQQRRRPDLGQGHAEASRAPADDRQPVTVGAGDGQVAALDDRGLLARDLGDRVAESVHVVEVDVGHDGDPAVPGVRRVEPPAEPDLDERDVGPDLGEPGEDDRGQQLELGRLAVAARDPIGRVEHATDQPGKVVGGDRPPVDADPLAIGHEVWLGRRTDAIAGRPERRVGQGEHAALAVGAGHQRAADRQLRMAELAQQRTRPAKPEPDAETAARRDRSQGLVVGEVGPRRGHRSPVTRGTARPRRRRTG